MEPPVLQSAQDRVRARVEHLHQIFNINEYALIKISDLNSGGVRKSCETLQVPNFAVKVAIFDLNILFIQIIKSGSAANDAMREKIDNGQKQLFHILFGIETLHIAEMDAIEEQLSNQQAMLRRGQNHVRNLEGVVADLRAKLEEKEQLLASITTSHLIEASDALIPEDPDHTEQQTRGSSSPSSSSEAETSEKKSTKVIKSTLAASSRPSEVRNDMDEDSIDITDDVGEERDAQTLETEQHVIIDAKKLAATVRAASNVDPPPSQPKGGEPLEEPEEDDEYLSSIIRTPPKQKRSSPLKRSRVSEEVAPLLSKKPPAAEERPVAGENQSPTPYPSTNPDSKFLRMCRQLQKMCDNPTMRNIVVSSNSNKITLLAWTAGTPAMAVEFQASRVSKTKSLKCEIFAPIFQYQPSDDGTPSTLSLVAVLTPRKLLTQEEYETEIDEDVMLPKYLDSKVWCAWKGHKLLQKRLNKVRLGGVPFSTTAPMLMHPSCSLWDQVCEFIPEEEHRSYLEFTEIVTNFGPGRPQGPKRFLFTMDHSVYGKNTEMGVPYKELLSAKEDEDADRPVVFSYRVASKLLKLLKNDDFERDYLRKSKIPSETASETKQTAQPKKKRGRPRKVAAESASESAKPPKKYTEDSADEYKPEKETPTKRRKERGDANEVDGNTVKHYSDEGLDVLGTANKLPPPVPRRRELWDDDSDPFKGMQQARKPKSNGEGFYVLGNKIPPPVARRRELWHDPDLLKGMTIEPALSKGKLIGNFGSWKA
jgi:hypothetical protein